MWTYIVGPFLAFLPKRWRTGRFTNISVNWETATLISGLIEALAAVVALVVWYSVFVTATGPAIWKYFPWPYAGEVGLLSFYMHPLTWVICYTGFEGAVRALAGLTTQESPGSLYLVLYDRAARFVGRGEWRGEPAPVRDKVDRHGLTGELRIASCKAKDHWKYPLTIRYEGEFFQVQGEEHAGAGRERPHVYRLKRLPDNEIIRGLEEYNPEDVLHEEKPPGFFATVAGELKKKWS
ncbi:MAG TPA: hypothetical protein VJN21_05520 [Candidatus Acidoferrales bacterium]|nr:hypothetical protein [Candidatus Acidoferrales bacterium]